MTDPLDRFETELNSLRPQPPSNALRQRIDEQLTAEPNADPRPSRSRWWAAAMLTAASLAIAFLVTQMTDDDRSTKIAAPTTASEVQESPLPLPTMIAYRQASRRSPETLETLLDEHAARLFPTHAQLGLADVYEELAVR